MCQSSILGGWHGAERQLNRMLDTLQKQKPEIASGFSILLKDACHLDPSQPRNHVNGQFEVRVTLEGEGIPQVAEATRTRDRRRPVETGTTLQTTLLRDVYSEGCPVQASLGRGPR